MEQILKSENILQQFDILPAEAKREVIDFIAFLQIRYERPVFVKKAKRPKSKNEPFIGMWKDRDDMSDSVTWARDLRRQKFVANM